MFDRVRKVQLSDGTVTYMNDSLIKEIREKQEVEKQRGEKTEKEKLRR